MSPLTKVVLQRLGLGLATLLAVSVIIAFIVELLPGDITEAILGQAATPEAVAAFRREIGLDQPAYIVQCSVKGHTRDEFVTDWNVACGVCNSETHWQQLRTPWGL